MLLQCINFTDSVLFSFGNECIVSPFSSIALGEDGNHSLDGAEHRSMDNHWPLPLLTVGTPTIMKLKAIKAFHEYHRTVPKQRATIATVPLHTSLDSFKTQQTVMPNSLFVHPTPTPTPTPTPASKFLSGIYIAATCSWNTHSAVVWFNPIKGHLINTWMWKWVRE